MIIPITNPPPILIDPNPTNPTTAPILPDYCPAGKRLRKKWTDRVKISADAFHSKNLFGYKNHVKKCLTCMTAYRARHGGVT